MSEDARFSAMHSAPIFKQSKKDNFKVKVDDRFKTLLSDKRFQSVPGQVDKYGRKVKDKDGSKKVAKEMKEFYDINQDEDDVAPAANAPSKKQKGAQGGSMDSRLDYLNKLARGEISEESSSESGDSSDGDSDSSDDSEASDPEVDTAEASHKRQSALQIPEQPEPELAVDVSSTRIAIQNCDWENLTAEDIMVVMQSFCPPGSGNSVRKVTVYVSDFGQKRMEAEARYGPQGIWKVQQQDDEEDNDDLYDQITGVDDSDEEDEGEEEVELSEESGEGSDTSQSGSDDDASESADDHKPAARAATTSRKALKKGDFIRKNGAVGLVMHTDLKLRGVASRYKSEESDEEVSKGSDGSGSGSEDESGADRDSAAEASHGKKKGAQAKKLKDGEGYDEVALRKYELSKLRYYFAIVECDSARTANLLYEELDGVEMESSSMVFDLSLVPEELDFAQREVRDSFSASASGAVNPNYKPPDFVVNALQHTKVQCSWDEGEKLRDRQLSNFSSWRNLNESELQQYVADSDSSEDENEEEEAAPKKKQQKAAAMRKMLLGDDDSQASGSGEEDDFFEKESASEGSRDSMYDSDDEVPDGLDAADRDGDDDGEGKTLTYMPDLGKELLAKKRGGQEETPYEAEQRKMAEKKKARKAAKKAFQEQQEAEKKAAVLAMKKPIGKGKPQKEEKLTAEEAKKRAELELLFDGADDAQAEDDYDMRALVLAEKEKARGKKSKRRKGTTEAVAAAGGDFKLDTADPRFSKLFEGDARFGIDKTSSEFRPTPASKEILSEQAKRRAQKERQQGGKPVAEATHAQAPVAEEARPVDVNNLVNKLKRKYAHA